MRILLVSVCLSIGVRRTSWGHFCGHDRTYVLNLDNTSSSPLSGAPGTQDSSLSRPGSKIFPQNRENSRAQIDAIGRVRWERIAWVARAGMRSP